MDDITQAVLRSWELRPSVILPLLLLAGLYVLGWTRLRRRGSRLANGWRLVSYWVGLLFVALALLSPIESLSSLLFTMHMVQHLLLAMLAPPLLLLAEPLPIVMWGLPATWRRRIGRLTFSRNAPLRPILQRFGQPVVMFALWTVFLWAWHDGALYSLALRSQIVHDVEHLTFFWTAMGLWWHLTGAAPRLGKRLSYAARFGLALAAVPANMILGIVIAFADRPIFTYYETVPRLWGLDIIADQQLGGVIMWVPGSMMYVIAALVCVARWMIEAERDGRRDLEAATLLPETAA